jgi:hypothetical protein
MMRLVMLKILARRNPLQNNPNIHNKINRQFVTSSRRILSHSKGLSPLCSTYISPYPIGEIVVFSTHSFETHLHLTTWISMLYNFSAV